MPFGGKRWEPSSASLRSHRQVLLTLSVIAIAVAAAREIAPVLARWVPDDNSRERITAPPIPGLSYQSAVKTVVAFIRTDCVYCTRSMAFYRQLDEDRNRTTNYRLAFVGYEKEEDLKFYLAAHRIYGDEVVRSNFRLARVLGTPTLSPALTC